MRPIYRAIIIAVFYSVSYIQPHETDLYYLQSRYYDPALRRFLNADGFTATGQSFIGNNMFAYCGNNPVNRADCTGLFWNGLLEFGKAVVAEIGKAMEVMAPAYAGCGGIAIADGPLPIGDVLALGGAAVFTIGAAVYGTYQATQAPSFSVSNAETEEKTETITISKRTKREVYFPDAPYKFNPIIVEPVIRDGTTNGKIITWMNPRTGEMVFRWDENVNWPNGPHYHIAGSPKHYYPGDVVPEPYASIYFPHLQ